MSGSMITTLPSTCSGLPLASVATRVFDAVARLAKANSSSARSRRGGVERGRFVMAFLAGGGSATGRPPQAAMLQF
jgi:hypothetical protein